MHSKKHWTAFPEDRTYIGKESGELENDDNMLLPEEVKIQLYQKEKWDDFYLPWLKKVSSSLIAEYTGLTKRAVNYIKSGRRYPKKETKSVIIAFIEKLAYVQCKEDFSKDAEKLKREYKNKFSKIISDNGYIAVGGNLYMAEEIKRYIPLHLRRKDGKQLDNMAELFRVHYSEYGIQTPDDLLEKFRSLHNPGQGAQGNRGKPHSLTGAWRTPKPG